MSALRTKAAASVWRNANLGHWNVTNVTVTNSPFWCSKFTIPGLTHESFDRDGNVKMTSIMLTSVIARQFVLHKPFNDSGSIFLDWPALTEDRFTFVSSTQFKMSKALYGSEVPKWPLDVEFILGFVGNSSMAGVTNFYNVGETSEPLWTQINQLVSIDKVTRKPTPLPDWFKDKYKGKGCMDQGLIIKPFNRPSLTYSMPVVVRWSDTDNYNHTNFASYVHWAINAIHAAIREEEKAKGLKSTVSADQLPSSALNGINKDIVSNGLKDVQICYLNESLEGQALNVHVWQQDNLEHKVFTSIERGEDDICQLQFEYFSSSTDEESAATNNKI
ncbi:unnamed protein product [Lymnaea stagnalis]|uniref:Uncharacterized protein n=1 Tax=Lymnaea stagnalis TaxID=6523 RepID=A0AAV2HQM4_LYMST